MFHRNIKDNVLITYMKVYENYMATLVAIATVLEKKFNDISYESTEPILMKFHS